MYAHTCVPVYISYVLSVLFFYRTLGNTVLYCIESSFEDYRKKEGFAYFEWIINFSTWNTETGSLPDIQYFSGFYFYPINIEVLTLVLPLPA